MGTFFTKDQPILVWTGSVTLDGLITIPRETSGIVLIAGLGFGTRQAGYRALAAKMNIAGMATLLADILTPDEQQFDSRTGHFRVDIPLLAGRIVSITRWIAKSDMTHDLPVAFLGSGVAAIAGLRAAADSDAFYALVLNRARLHLVEGAAQRVMAPVLLIEDADVSAVRASRLDEKSLAAPHKLEIVGGAADVGEDVVAANAIAEHALRWYRTHEPLAVSR